VNLVIENLSKRYSGGVWGLRDFTLELGPGVLGLLGPNGAGKSTLMTIVATITRPTQGRVLWRDRYRRGAERDPLGARLRAAGLRRLS
jgi:ABC-type multidrug transport system ATPase subunit